MTAGLARAGAATFAGTVFGAALTFILTGVVTQSLDAADTGYFFQILALFAITSSALQLGADTTLVRTLSAQLALGQQAVLSRSVWTAVVPVAGAGVVVGAAAWLGAGSIAALLNPDAPDEMAGMIRSVAPFVGAASMLAVLLGGTRGLGGTAPYTLLQNVVLPVLRLALVIAVAAAGLGLHAIVTVWAAPTAVAAITAAVLLGRRLRRARLEPVPADAVPFDEHGATRRFWGFALPRAGSTLIERLLDWSGVLLVIAMAGPAVGGIYAVVNRCASAGYMLDTAARIVTGPRISRALAREDRPAAERLFLDVTRTMILISWPFYLTLSVFSPVVLGLFGAEFVAGASALTIVALAMMIASAAGMVQSVLLMGGRSSWQLLNRILQLGTLVTLTVLLVPALGLLGAAVAWVGAIALDTALATTQVAVKMGIRSSLRRIAPAAGLTLALFGGGGLLARALFGESLMALILALCLLGPAYLGCCFLLRRALGIAGSVPRAGAPLQRVVPAEPAPPALGNIAGAASPATIDTAPSASQSHVGLLDPENAANGPVLVRSIPGSKD